MTVFLALTVAGACGAVITATMMRYAGLKYALGTVVLLAVLAGSAHYVGARDQAPAPVCAHEDGAGSALPCTWDAGVNENGHRVTITYSETQ